MSSSVQSRSSSGVRNLRSIFEHKASESNNILTPDSRGRSPNGVGSDKENGGRPTSKVRANFVAVEPAPMMAGTTTTETAALRRGSFGEADGDVGLKKTISGQQHVLQVPEAAVESVPASAVATPTRSPMSLLLGYGAEEAERKPANPDKPTTAAEEEPGDMKPAELSNELAVSGGEALPPVAEDLRPAVQSTLAKSTKKPDSKPSKVSVTKPPAITTKPASKPSAPSLKSPMSQPKTPNSAKVSSSTDSPIAKRPPRSSLTAPTAASMARAGPSDKVAASKTSPTTKPKPREVTRPLNIPSHLTAPTASSKAKHEPEDISAPAPRATVPQRPKAQNPAKPRTSLAAAPRPKSRDSSSSARRSLAPVDGSFLDRMTRPTAASANRTSDKVEARSPPSKSKTALKAKTNGVPKAASGAGSTSQQASQPNVEAPAPALALAEESTTVKETIAAVEHAGPAGSETPVHTNGEVNPALEATPAGLAVDNAIR